MVKRKQANAYLFFSVLLLYSLFMFVCIRLVGRKTGGGLSFTTGRHHNRSGLNIKKKGATGYRLRKNVLLWPKLLLLFAASRPDRVSLPCYMILHPACLWLKCVSVKTGTERERAEMSSSSSSLLEVLFFLLRGEEDDRK